MSPSVGSRCGPWPASRGRPRIVALSPLSSIEQATSTVGPAEPDLWRGTPVFWRSGSTWSPSASHSAPGHGSHHSGHLSRARGANLQVFSERGCQPDRILDGHRIEARRQSTPLWNPPLVWGTAMIAIGSSAIALPIGLLSAIYLSEYAPRTVRAFLKPRSSFWLASPQSSTATWHCYS